MLTTETIQKMKQSNISVNGELTKERTKEILKTASRTQKHEIDELAGIKRTSINRVYATGTISAKVAVAIGQTLNIDPAYLTGEAEERGEYNEASLEAFLESKGYKEFIPQAVKVRKKRGRPLKQSVPDVEAIPVSKTTAAEDPLPSEDVTIIDIPPEAKTSASAETSVKELRPSADLSEDEAVLLLRALYLQAGFGGTAANTLEKVQGLLV